MSGLDEELGLEINETVEIAEEKPKRKLFHYWEVGDKEYKMKLNASMIAKLEDKYRQNILTLIMGDNLPALGTMLTVAQAAISPWKQKVSYNDVERLYDEYVGDGGNIDDFMTDIIIPTMAVSGFFTESQERALMEELKERKQLA